MILFLLNSKAWPHFIDLLPTFFFLPSYLLFIMQYSFKNKPGIAQLEESSNTFTIQLLLFISIKIVSSHVILCSVVRLNSKILTSAQNLWQNLRAISNLGFSSPIILPSWYCHNGQLVHISSLHRAKAGETPWAGYYSHNWGNLDCLSNRLNMHIDNMLTPHKNLLAANHHGPTKRPVWCFWSAAVPLWV